jgi:hypothetical protein
MGSGNNTLNIAKSSMQQNNGYKQLYVEIEIQLNTQVIAGNE